MTRSDAEKAIANCLDFNTLTSFARNANNKHPKAFASFKLAKLYPSGKDGVPTIFVEKYSDLPPEKIEEFWHKATKIYSPVDQGKALQAKVLASCQASRIARSKSKGK